MLRRTTSKPWLVCLTVSLLAAMTACSRPASQPNFLVVLVDALRPDHLGFYGYSEPTSPFLDEIAGQSIVFDQAYVHAPQTISSTASLFTSQFFPPILFIDPESVGKEDLRGRILKSGTKIKILAPLEPTFPELLASASYRTAAFLTNPHHHADSGFPALFTDPHLFLSAHERQLRGEAGKSEKPYLEGASLGDAYIDWLTTMDDREQPVFAYVHFMDVHNPYRPPEPFASKFVKVRGKDRYVNGIPSAERIPSEMDLTFMRQNYDGEIAYVDSVIRRIHEATLKHMTRKTVLIVTSDHGDEFMEHAGLGHGQTLELEQIRAPLLIHGSGLPPRRHAQLVRHVDLGPTVLALADAAPMRNTDGRDLIALLRSDAAPSRPFSVAHAFQGLTSITTPEWHFIKNRNNGAVTLYDKVRDPEGRRNLARERPEEVRRFEVQLEPIEKRRREVGRKTAKMARQVVSEELLNFPPDEVLDQLRALGYLQ